MILLRSRSRLLIGSAFLCRPRAAARLAALSALLLAAACGDAESALARGDRLWADARYADALAEYRLSFQRRPESDDVLARLAHAYAISGQLERARDHYDILLSRAPEYADLAIFDFLRLANAARERSDRFGMATAVEAANAIRPGLPVDHMAPTLARYYASTGEPERAVEYFERAVAAAPRDSVPALLFDLARLHETQGECEEAIALYRSYLARVGTRARADEARWQIGSCSFALAQRARRSDSLDLALRRLQDVLDLGVPQTLVDQAWFERGEILALLGRPDEATAAFLTVLELTRGRPSPLSERARQRIDSLRFGRDDGARPDYDGA